MPDVLVLVRIMLNGIGKLSSVSTTNVCRRDGDVLLSDPHLQIRGVGGRSPKMFFSAPRGLSLV